MALAIVEADGLDARVALQRLAERDGGILAAGEQDERGVGGEGHELYRSVMPGLVPGIHVFLHCYSILDVDGRDKPGHDGIV